MVSVLFMGKLVLSLISVFAENAHRGVQHGQHMIENQRLKKPIVSTTTSWQAY